jgi:catechol 2,3-dioxygenase-like lactoylglutathione lyase family enzyme
MIDRIDHFVLTVTSIDATCAFYGRTLGMARIDTAGRPTALAFGDQKISLHQFDRMFEPKAGSPTPGAGDFCLVAAVPLDEVKQHLDHLGVEIELGPVPRNGTLGPMHSLYFRDPDRNLVEICRYDRDE